MVADPASKKPSTVPFPAIVGQPALKEVLLLAAAHTDLSGAVITGEKGTAKSTAVRALVDLLPDQEAVVDCPYGCDPDDPAGQCADCQARPREELPVETRSVPLVTLPLGATRDRVVGTLSIQDAMAGDAEFDPGLLARAHRGILYVDEINLLDDHLVDVLLDAAASGVNTVERDGISVSHPAEFTLIGTMNPEEGELRPQLRDRFDLQATVTGSQDLDDRVAIIDRALAPDEEATTDEFGEEIAALRESLRMARESVGEVSLPEAFKRTIAELCTEAEVDGHRADIATARAAMALAALDGRPKVIESDIRTAASYTLPHRLQSQPFEEPPDPEDLLDDYFDDEEDDSEADDDGSAADDEDDSESEPDEDGDGAEDEQNEETDEERGDSDDIDDEGGEPDSADQPDGERGQREAGRGDAGQDDADSDGDEESGSDDGGGENETEGTPLVPGQKRAAIGDGEAPDIDGEEPDVRREGGRAGRRGRTQSRGTRGTRIRTEQATGEGSVDAAASVRSAAASGHSRVEEEDLRQSVRERETAATVVFAVDASASMRPAMEAAKGVVLDLLREAYQQRDEVAFVAFGGEDAELLLPPTSSVSLAARHLKDLPTGDRTPLPAGLDMARQVLDGSEAGLGVVVLVTDGRANVAEGSPTQATREAARRLADAGVEVVIVDADDQDRDGLIPTIAETTGGRTVPLSALSPGLVSAAVDGSATDPQ